jgi:glycosyltransferase involved in cell wall biosynthesis
MRDMLIHGEVLFAEGKIEDAGKCFLEVLNQEPKNKEAYNNLGVLAFGKKDLEEAKSYFLEALKIDPLYHDALDNLNMLTTPTKNIITSKDNLAINNSLTNHCLAIINSFDNKFNNIYASYFSKRNEVRIIKPNTEKDLSLVSEWADIIWCTWCNEPLVYLSQNKKTDVLVTNIRSYEILTPPLLRNVRWQNVDGAIFVADHIREIANKIWGEQLSVVPQTTIHNCVSLENYPFHQNGPGKNVCYIGYLNHKKGIGLLLQCIKEAVNFNKAFRFYIAGNFQETRFEVYMKHLIKEMELIDNVVFKGWVANVPDFLKDMNYVISTSPWEGCPNNLIEAMACGIKPLIHNWHGAKELFPSDLVFNSVGEFISILQKNDYDPAYYRKWVATHFNASIQLPKIDDFMARMWGKQHSRNHANRLGQNFK